MTLSTTTVIVLVANGVTAIVAAALLMLVLWQAPRQRMNQLFAIAMFLLAAYSVANVFGRFIDPLGLNPAATTYVAVSFYGLFMIEMFYFASEFSGNRGWTTRLLRAVGLVVIAAQLVGLWTDQLLQNIRPLDSADGSYQSDWTAWGYVSLVAIVAFLVMSAVVLYRAHDQRGRSLWIAPVLVLAAAFSAAVVWPLFHIPLQAVFLALAALALGLPVLRHELFNPLAALHTELAHKNAELREVSRLKSQFLANMSHELRTPLNSIIGYTQLVVNGTYGTLNDTQRNRLEKVVRNGYNLLNLINDVLDLNRIETGRVALDCQPLDTSDLLNSVLEVIEPLATQKGLRITRDFADSPPALVDTIRARQIVTNILANAIKFTPKGSVTVRAQADGAFVRFEVSDTGIGIAPDQIDAVFAEFRQVDDSTTREFEGTGLGMAITKRLVELHGGRIWIDSVPGEGTTVYTTLPAAPQEAVAVPEPAAVRATA